MVHLDHIPSGRIGRFFHEIREGSRRQGNVIFALLFRELKNKSGSEGYGLLSLVGILIEPVIAVLILAAFWYTLRRQEIQGVHVALFLAISYTPFSIFRRSITSVPRSIRASRSFYAFQSVKPIDAIIARYTLEMILTVIGGVVLVLILWWFLDLSLSSSMILEACGLFLAMIAGGLGVSLFIGVYGTRFPMVFKAIQLGGRGLLFISAVMHPASELPKEAQGVIAWNPIAHFEELFRSYLLGTTPFPDVSLSYFLFSMLTVLFLGLTSYYANRFKVLER